MPDHDSGRREIFMNIPALDPAHCTSFEEQRMLDYLTSYRTHGRPPQPVPVNPTDRQSRERLDLPPHYEPYIENSGVAASFEECSAMATKLLLLSSTSEPPPSKVEDLPDVQVFEPTIDATEVGHKSKMQNIVCQHSFSKFQPEELRVRAYAVGKKSVPEVAKTSVDTGEGEIVSITATPAFSGHSFEELRVAYLRLGKEVSSSEITRIRVFG